MCGVQQYNISYTMAGVEGSGGPRQSVGDAGRVGRDVGATSGEGAAWVGRAPSSRYATTPVYSPPTEKPMTHRSASSARRNL